MADHKGENGSGKAVNRQKNVRLALIQLLNQQGAQRHTDHGTHGGNDTQNSHQVLAAQDHRCGLYLDTHSHLTAKAQEVRNNHQH